MHPIYSKLQQIVSDARLNGATSMTIKIMLKEYLQNHVLQAIYNDKDTQDLIFYGGTALRKIFDLDRMSEDLDFESQEDVDLEKTAQTIFSYFQRQKLEKIEYKIQREEIINRITFKFEILYDLGLSSNNSEKLHVKVDINPQTKGKFETQLSPFVMDQMSMLIKHYSLPVMMAGKIGACLDRVFKKGKTGIKIKGRDYYDLIWYMQQKIIPDEAYLRDLGYGDDVFMKLDEKVKKITPKDLLFDLQPYFVSKNYIERWCEEFWGLYERYREYLV